MLRGGGDVANVAAVAVLVVTMAVAKTGLLIPVVAVGDQNVVRVWWLCHGRYSRRFAEPLFKLGVVEVDVTCHRMCH